MAIRNIRLVLEIRFKGKRWLMFTLWNRIRNTIIMDMNHPGINAALFFETIV